MTHKLYDLENKFIKQTNKFNPVNFTGIVISRNKDKFWYLNGVFHRLDGPAYVSFNGSKEWWVNGKLHRLDGPAGEYSDGDKQWYIDGKMIEGATEESFKFLVDIMKLKGLL